MTDQFTCTGWACVDCLILLANGDVPAEMTADEITEWQSRIDASTDGFNVTLGMLRDSHECPEGTDECECETRTFSWSACDVCGSNLGGERHAVSFWRINP